MTMHPNKQAFFDCPEVAERIAAGVEKVLRYKKEKRSQVAQKNAAYSAGRYYPQRQRDWIAAEVLRIAAEVSRRNRQTP